MSLSTCDVIRYGKKNVISKNEMWCCLLDCVYFTDVQGCTTKHYLKFISIKPIILQNNKVFWETLYVIRKTPLSLLSVKAICTLLTFYVPWFLSYTPHQFHSIQTSLVLSDRPRTVLVCNVHIQPPLHDPYRWNQ